MKRKEFIERFEKLRAETTLYGNCMDVSNYFGYAVSKEFKKVFRHITSLDDGSTRYNHIQTYWLRYDLDDSLLSREDIETQRVINFELFYWHCLEHKLYKDF